MCSQVIVKLGEGVLDDVATRVSEARGDAADISGIVNKPQDSEAIVRVGIGRGATCRVRIDPYPAG